MTDNTTTAPVIIFDDVMLEVFETAKALGDTMTTEFISEYALSIIAAKATDVTIVEVEVREHDKYWCAPLEDALRAGLRGHDTSRGGHLVLKVTRV